jgi:ribosomal protein L11 methyltransferase
VTRAVRVSVPDAEAELAADALWQAGAAAIEEQPGALIAGTRHGGDPARLLAAVAGRWPAEVVAVDLDAALDAWRVHARAVTVGERLVVRPPWVPPPPGDTLDLVIDPGRAFGSGAHPSTRLVLAALCRVVRGGERVLDVGCGSGVLAIAALALGAGRAVGVDVDRAAVAATAENAARNGVADRLVVVGDVAALADLGARDAVSADFDLVVANMLLPELVAAAPVVAGALAHGGSVVISGMLVDQRDEVLAAYRRAGLELVGDDEDAGWLALTVRGA